MSRPTEFVDWDINNVNSTRPDDSIKDNGYADNDIPDAGDINWIFQFLSAWIKYLDPLVNGAVWLLGSDFVLAQSGGTAVLDGTAWESHTTGGNQNLVGRIPLHPGARITAVTVYGKCGNSAGEEISALLAKVDTTLTTTQISTTKTSGHIGANTNIGWTTADTDLTPNGYTLDDNPHLVQVVLPQTSANAEAQLYSVKIQLG